MRGDLTEAELRILERETEITIPPHSIMAQRIRRLIGELRELRDREAAARQLSQQEGEY